MTLQNKMKRAGIMFVFTTLILFTFGCKPKGLHSGAVNLPPHNKYLANSPWPVNHGDPYYQQNSRTYPGPAVATAGKPDFLLGRPGMLNSYFSDPYPDGSVVIWGSAVGEVYKIDPMGKSLRFIDRMKTYDFKWMPDKMVTSQKVRVGSGHGALFSKVRITSDDSDYSPRPGFQLP